MIISFLSVSGNLRLTVLLYQEKYFILDYFSQHTIFVCVENFYRI